MVKSVENAYRHMDITLANQLSLAFPNDNIREVLKLVGTKWNIETFHPGIGAGGYCIPLSSRYILSQVKSSNKLSLLRETIKTRLNLEIAATEEMLSIALDVKPDMITLVPEKREEITTEGGLDIIANKEKLKIFVDKIQSAGIPISLFVDPIFSQLEASSNISVCWVELHTGTYALSSWKNQALEFSKIKEGVIKARNLGLRVNAGHGLTYQNVEPIASIQGIEELNIGHTIISRALAIGLQDAVKQMKEIIRNPRQEPFFG